MQPTSRLGSAFRWTFALPGAAAFALPLAAYVASAPHWPDGWDYGEAQVVPYVLGIFHPTGFPLYTLIGWAFSHAVAVSTVAWRMNVLSGLSVAGAALAAFALARGWGAGRIAALTGALAFAFTGPVWINAIHAEVHALLLAAIAGTLVALQRALTLRSARWFVAAAALLGCGLAIHSTAIWLLPGVVLGALVLHGTFDRANVVAAVAAFFAPLLTYAYLPLRAAVIARSHLDPNAGPPLDGAGATVWGMLHTDTWLGFKTEITGSQFGASSFAISAANPLHWPAYALQWFGHARDELTLVTALLALAGLLAVAVRRPAQLAVLVAGLGAVPFGLEYAPVSVDIMRYLLPSFLTAAALAAAAPAIVPEGRPRIVASAVVALLLAGAAWHEFDVHRSNFAYRDSRASQEPIDIVRDHTPDGAIVIASWLDATALSYGKYVDDSLGDRLIVYAWPDDIRGAVRRWAKVRPVFVDVDFVLRSQMAPTFPASWVKPVGTWSDHAIVQIVPPA